MEESTDKAQGAETKPETPRPGDQGAGRPNVVATDDPAIAAPAPAHAPDRPASLDTSGILGTTEAGGTRFVAVPAEAGRPPGPAVAKGQGPGKGGHGDAPGRPAGGHSLWTILLYAGLVSLACGVAGAWAYSHFFGEEKSARGSGSGKDSGSGKGSNSDSGSRKDAAPAAKGEDSDRLAQAQSAWTAAVQELKEVRDAEKQARKSAEESRAVLGFLEQALLSGRGSGDGALAKAFWNGGKGGDPTLRQAVDAAEAQVGSTFGDRPLAEAAVREVLGQAYLALNEAAKGVKQYERALALRQAVEGSTDPDTAACRNKLAVAYRLAGRAAEGSRLFETTPDSPARADALAVQGSMLLAGKKPAEAELPLRESLTIRRKLQPDAWSTFDAESAVGQALLDQKKLVEAEPLLIEGYEGLSKRAAAIPADDKPAIDRARNRLVSLYQAWGKPEQAAKWKAKPDAPK